MGHKLRLLRLAFWLCNSSAAGSCFFFSNQECGPICILLRWAPIPLQLTLVRCMKWWSIEVDLVVGTPPQRVSVILDTGSGAALTCRNCWSDILAFWALIYVWPWHDPWFAEARFVHILAPTVGIACCLVKGLKRFEDVWIHRFKKIEVAITLTLRPKPKNGRASNWHYFDTQRQASS